MGSKVLFTHLIIILIQYFSVFSFSFQFLVLVFSFQLYPNGPLYAQVCMNELYLIGVVFGGSGERERERVIYTYMVEWFNQNTSKSQRQAQEWEINLF